MDSACVSCFISCAISKQLVVVAWVIELRRILRLLLKAVQRVLCYGIKQVASWQHPHVFQPKEIYC